MSTECKGKSSWPELLGAHAKDAVVTIETQNRYVDAQLVPEGSVVTADFVCTRVRVWINKYKIVTRVPIIANNSSDGREWLRTQFDRNCSFFYAEFPEGTILFHPVEENEKFPAQFGRNVLAGLLNMPERADWRNCTLSNEEETKMAEEFKKQFEEFDPTQ